MSETLKTSSVGALARDRMRKLHQYTSLNARLKSFEHEKWPYPHTGKKVNATTLAKAGFVRGTVKREERLDDLCQFKIIIDDENDDTVFCPFCMKHLDGWEEDDNCFVEHRRHRENCVFTQQSTSERARTSQWQDPFAKNVKKPFSLAAIRKMKSTISIANHQLISSSNDAFLDDLAKKMEKESNLIGKGAKIGATVPLLNAKARGKLKLKWGPRDLAHRQALSIMLPGVNQNSTETSDLDEVTYSQICEIKENIQNFPKSAPKKSNIPSGSILVDTTTIVDKNIANISNIDGKELTSPGTPIIGTEKIIYRPCVVTVTQDNAQKFKKMKKLSQMID